MQRTTAFLIYLTRRAVYRYIFTKLRSPDKSLIWWIDLLKNSRQCYLYGTAITAFKVSNSCCFILILDFSSWEWSFTIFISSKSIAFEPGNKNTLKYFFTFHTCLVGTAGGRGWKKYSGSSRRTLMWSQAGSEDEAVAAAHMRVVHETALLM